MYLIIQKHPLNPQNIMHIKNLSNSVNLIFIACAIRNHAANAVMQ